MPLSPLLGKASSLANTEVIVYTVPAEKQFANVSVNLTNTGITASTIELGITTGSSLTTVDYIEKGTQLADTGGSLRRTNIIMGPGEKLIVKATTSDVGIRVFGLEQY